MRERGGEGEREEASSSSCVESRDKDLRSRE